MSRPPAPKPAIDISLGEAADDAPVPDIYDKFSEKRKNAIVAVVAFAALLARNSASTRGVEPSLTLDGRASIRVLRVPALHPSDIT